MKKKIALIVTAALGLSLVTACGSKTETTTEATTEATTVAEETTEEVTEEVAEATADNASSGDAWEYGEYTYTGDDNVLYAINYYMCDELAKNYDKADVSIPVVNVIDRDESDPQDIKVYGDFSLYNYNLEGDTLVCQSGGNYPGCFHVKETDAGAGFVVTSFDVVEDGANYDESAKKIFGDLYEDFTKVSSDDETREQIRKDTIAEYCSSHNVPATKYQDYGWDPVEFSAGDSADNEVVYMGGLYATDGESDMNLALFRSSGTPVVVIQEGKNYYYGEFTTEDAKLEDGTEYVKIYVEDKVFGYHFDDETAMSGFLVDENGKSHKAVGLDESVALEMKQATE
ncbi:MAG: hypothetical protein K6F55_07590 [Eubacterium sp.]|nr:hypothetical protein [Eubacterium sp.]